jgi:hypothetical protein
VNVKEKIAEFIARGAVQLSRKYRRIAVPPELPPGQTFLAMLRERDPVQWEKLEEQARSHLLYRDEQSHIELSFDEFNEWLVQRGCQPAGKPPAPYETWGQYWRENDKHPGQEERLSPEERLARIPESVDDGARGRS